MYIDFFFGLWRVRAARSHSEKPHETPPTETGSVPTEHFSTQAPCAAPSDVDKPSPSSLDWAGGHVGRKVTGTATRTHCTAQHCCQYPASTQPCCINDA